MTTLRTIGRECILFVGLFALCLMTTQAASAGDADFLVSPELLRHAGLEIVWTSELPMKPAVSMPNGKAEILAQLLLLGNRVYAISSANYMVSMDKDTGQTVFARSIAPAGIPVTGLRLYGDTILSVGGSKLEELDAQTGVQLSQVDVGLGITCPAARNSGFYYVACTDNRMHVYRAEDRVQIFEAAAINNSTITSIVADDEFVVFATDEGDVIAVAPDVPRRLWQFKAAEAIAGPVVKDWKSLFFASEDTNVYRLDVVGLPEKTQLVWKYQAAAVLDQAPRVTQEVVYQPVRGKGVTAIDRETGSRLWRVPGGADLLAEAGGKAYVITKGEKLVVMDNAKAQTIYSVNFTGVTVYASNTGDDKIYIADKRGRVMCLKPVE